MGGTLVISHTTLAHNGSDRAGAISTTGGVVLIAHTLFIGNGGLLNSGGLYAFGASTVIISHTTFAENVAELSGALGIDDEAVVTITDTTFEDNIGDGESGGITNSGILTITNSTFARNQAIFHPAGGLTNLGTVHYECHLRRQHGQWHRRLQPHIPAEYDPRS